MPANVDFLGFIALPTPLQAMAIRVSTAVMTIRNIDDAILDRLRERAAVRGRSMEDEARDILYAALSTEMSRPKNLGRAIHERFAILGGVTLPELPRHVLEEPCRPASKI
jgi:antitoxin FitA